MDWDRRRALGALAGFALASCAGKNETRMKTEITQQSWGKTEDGSAVELYHLSSGRGLEVTITNYGGRVVSLRAPGGSGPPADVVLGFDSLDGYLKPNPYFGAIIGRYGNRIGHARFRLGGVEYKLAQNNGENSLHGGVRGFDKVVWQPWKNAQALELTYRSKDGEEGYPGNLTAAVTYTVTADNSLRIDYSATSDRDTVVNLTNHSYFNLAGQGEGDILDHEVTIFASRFTPIDAGLIPTGELRPVAGTPFDFRQPTSIGARIGQDDPQLKLGRGYDHNFVLDGSGDSPRPAAHVRDPKSGRVMEVLTTEPGMQFYTGNFLDGTIRGKGGQVYGHRCAFCMETQHFPDSPNKPAFPSVVLQAGGQYRSTTIYRFS